MCSLRDNDGIRPNLALWLGSLVVHPDYQQKGIAPKLINAMKQKAKQLGFSQLYLFTFDPTLPNYYSKLGWNRIGMDKFKGHDVNVMDIAL
nr:GNAT family N-acetyltransferase [Legionella nagasakiensis]